MIRRTALALVIASASFLAHAETPAPAQAKATPAVDVAKGQRIAAGVCAACHNADGNSLIPANPILAGQHRDYLLKQMMDFKPGAGSSPARMSPIMNGMIMSVPNEDMKSVAAYFASQTAKPAAAKDEKLAAAGQKLWRAGDHAKGVPACAGCHGASGAGMPAQYPRLAGQHPEYTEAQLKAFRTGDRANDSENVMRMIAAKMSDSEIKAVAEYAAGLR